MTRNRNAKPKRWLPVRNSAPEGASTGPAETSASRSRSDWFFGLGKSWARAGGGAFSSELERLSDDATDAWTKYAWYYRYRTVYQERLTLEASSAKLFATEMAQRVVDKALQLHGGQGVLKGATVERLYREVRALRIYEGTSEIQKLVIGRHIFKERR